MTTYQGPNASVTQQFVVSPGAVAIEDLPPAIVATAFDVFSKENIGSHYGIVDQELTWSDEDGNTIDKVVYDKDVIDQRSYDFYPPKLFGNTIFGNIDLELTSSNIGSTGPTITVDKDYSLPNVEKVAGVSSAIIPYYNKTSQSVSSGTATSNVLNELNASGSTFETDDVLPGDLVVSSDNISALVLTVESETRLTLDGDAAPDGNETFTIYRPIKILSTDLNTVIIPSGSVVTAQLKPGQTVFMLGTDSADTTTWTEIGTVQSIGADETKVNLSTSVAAAVNGYQIIIGAAGSTAALRDTPNTLYDENADFIANKVRVGDLLKFSSQAITGTVTTPEVATVTSVINKNTIKFNTENLNASANGHIDSDFSKYKYTSVTPGSTVSVYSYDITRLVGFSENLQYKDLNSGAGVPVTYVSDTTFYIPDTVGGDSVPAPTAGDIFAMTAANNGATTEDRSAFTYMRLYKMDTVQYDSGNSRYVVNVSSVIYFSSSSATEVAYDNGDFVHVWTPKIETNVLGDFRAVRTEENQVVKRITSVEDIFTNWVRSGEESIDPRNELAFMMNIAFQRSGGKVCYGVNVDATAANLSTEYGLAFDELKIYDVYSHALGTTNAGVNGTVASYVNAQSEPYEAHERIAVLGYDEQDVYLQGTDTGSNTSGGLITINGSFNPITAGVTVSDKVKIYTSANVFVEEVSVTATPSSTTQIQTNGSVAYASGHVYKFLSGRKADQAQKISSLGIGQRRVSIVWPGYFSARFGNENLTEVPPYFITAAITGMDSANLASQSFTRLDFAIPGLSNISLNTSTYFLKSDLDEIGGGGIDLMIQDSSITQTIKSRHDLTTDMSAVQLRERSITKQADVSAKTIRAAIDPYVGKYNIDQNLLNFIGQVCGVVSTKLVKNGVIKKLKIKSIKRDEVIDDKINIFLEATAFIAGNYYDVTLLVVTR